MFSLAPCPRDFFFIMITSLGKERHGLYVSCAFVCLSCLCYSLSSSLPLCVGGLLWIVIVALPGLSM